MRFLALIILVLLMLLKHNAHASTLECFTDETKRYEFNIGDQKTGLFWAEVNHESGPLKGMTYKFVVKDLSSLKSYDDYLVKRMTVGVPYTITYALRCKILE